MDLSQFGINTENVTGGVTVPGLEGLQSMLGTIMIGSAVIGGLFFVLYLISVVQRIRADRAMIAMHKDITAIRGLLEQRQAPASAPVPIPEPAPIRDESASASATLERTN